MQPLGVAALGRALRLGRAGAALPRTACRARRLGDPPPRPGAASRAYAAEGGGSAAGDDDAAAAAAAASIHGMSKKKQRHHLNQLLKSLGAGPAQREATERIMPMTVVDVNRTTKVTKGGSLMRFTATVVCGNGGGLAGWGKGKASEVSVAVDKAHARAQRNLYFFELYRGHTIFHDVKQKYGGTTVLLRAAPSGTGVQANRTVKAICELAGIKDLRGKIIGSSHPANTVKATFEALDKVRSPEEVGAARGMIFTEVIPR